MNKKSYFVRLRTTIYILIKILNEKKNQNRIKKVRFFIKIGYLNLYIFFFKPIHSSLRSV